MFSFDGFAGFQLDLISSWDSTWSCKHTLHVVSMTTQSSAAHWLKGDDFRSFSRREIEERQRQIVAASCAGWLAVGQPGGRGRRLHVE